MSFQESFRGEKRSKDNPLVNDPIAGWKIQHFDISMAMLVYQRVYCGEHDDSCCEKAPVAPRG